DKILDGDENAREQYIYGNLRLVLSIIQRFNNRGEYVDDIFQVGCIGLIKAIDNFDINHGVQFSTYAVPMIILRRNSNCTIIINLNSTMFSLKKYTLLSLRECIFTSLNYEIISVEYRTLLLLLPLN
ncbi:MAG: sigma-70 family RNA polymerase sigma factor, partial [Methanobrevibacter sp.]|nr:sigma-70 family RNA polymerase sigma factor [Candidatus Methanovirga basalitermitum]